MQKLKIFLWFIPYMGIIYCMISVFNPNLLWIARDWKIEIMVGLFIQIISIILFPILINF